MEEEWSGYTLHALVYIPKLHVSPTQGLEVLLLLAVLVIIVTTGHNETSYIYEPQFLILKFYVQ